MKQRIDLGSDLSRASRVGLCATLLVLAGFVEAPAHTPKFQTIYSFCSQEKCVDGSNPGQLIMDRAGNVFGITQSYQKNIRGTVFELVPDGQGGWVHQVLFTFPKGMPPTSDVILDSHGNFYGTSGNLAYKLSPGVRWKLKTLYTFCSVGGESCTDGAFPVGGFIYDGATRGKPYDGVSPLYGVTHGGGGEAQDAGGVAFQLNPAHEEWTEKVLFSFCPEGGGLDCPNGSFPSTSLVMDDAGNIFGGTGEGGQSGLAGVVYELTPNSDKSEWTETVINNFCFLCENGQGPAGLILDVTGNLLGVTYSGGDGNYGVLFKLIPNGNSWQETVLYTFASQGDRSDGAFPFGRLAFDSKGNLFGSTALGGAKDGGVLFEFDGAYHVLHYFCTKESCRDGTGPGWFLVNKRKILGTTLGGGANGGGTAFELTP